MSIKEKALEIKGFLSGEQRVPLLVVMTLLMSALGSYGLGFAAGKGTALPEPVPRTMDANLAGVPSGSSGSPRTVTPGNESTGSASQGIESAATAPFASSTSPQEKVAAFVGSRKGTKYHFPWCPGAKTISEENLVQFSSREEAEAGGYTPAANCKGL